MRMRLTYSLWSLYRSVKEGRVPSAASFVRADGTYAPVNEQVKVVSGSF